MTIALETLLSRFLERQDLRDCRIAFEPARAVAGRRAKRSTATIRDALDPMEQPKVQGARTVQDLFDRLLNLSSELKGWTEGLSKPYVLRLYNIEGKIVHPSTKLDDIRKFADALEKKNRESVRRLLLEALQASDRFLEPSAVDEIAICLVAERKSP